ncbi:VOC family protein [Sphingomonas sabuli]|uniref:VOC family protein n=1 Tax=Sphingomonas sabuli TaxID=2764186 RepID=A0A7G9L3N8_9SPHN|nr:VOC family protein [Sphingomonas sabuli]QNM83237.1 VOC family protein [Sphingomonas sabuli]
MTAVVSMKTKIVTPRVEATRDWYRDLFGLTVLEEWNEPNDCGCILGLHGTAGEATLEIYHGCRDYDFSGVGLQFRVEDVDAFAVPADDRFRARGPVSRPWGSRYLFLSDPNGISIVVFSGSSL